ncbi:magnesium transporter [Brachybacterium hainanense]|uniref:Magnesium transporter MgtE n=1 Tax=Brachybacterium hainanense TaxID=1541174 RepID=A0ABV6REP7_9MICO
MTFQDPAVDLDVTAQTISRAIAERDLTGLARQLGTLDLSQILDIGGRLEDRQRAVMFRLLPKDRALEVFERLDPALQRELVHDLQGGEVAELFAALEPDDRVWLLDELPAALATRLLRGLPDHERALTASVLGYPQHSVGRRMSPAYVSARPEHTAGQTLERVRARIDDAETIYTIPVLDATRHLVGIISLRDVLRAESSTALEQLMVDPHSALATEDAELAARRCAELRMPALPVVDAEQRLVGILTLDDAVRILEREEDEDSARQGGVEPLRRPYLATPVRSLVRSRIVWLLVLAVGATLTVQVLDAFEATLEQVTVLALFVPLLIGTGGNTGNQAATTVTRALALGDVGPRDVLRVLARELRVGLLMGLLLGVLGAVIAGLLYSPGIGLVIGLTLVGICAVAATIGGVMPLVARAVRVDPAVFSNPFISTFVDATGLVVYFVIARAVLGI